MAKNEDIEEDEDDDFDLDDDDEEDEDKPKKAVQRGRPPIQHKLEKPSKKKEGRYTRVIQQAFDGFYDNGTQTHGDLMDALITVMNQLDEVINRIGE